MNERREVVGVDVEGFMRFCDSFSDQTRKNGVLVIRDDFAFHNQGGRDKRWKFIAEADRSGLSPEVKLTGGVSEIFVNLPREVGGIKRVEYFLTQDM